MPHRLSQNKLFAGISEPALSAFATYVKEVSFLPETFVMHEGELGESLFLVVSGRLRVAISGLNSEQMAVAHLEAGDCAGEIAVLTGDRRAASVVAEQPSQLLELPRHAFDAVSRTYPDDVSRILARIKASIERRQLSTALRRNSLFAALPPQVLSDLDEELKSTFLSGGEILFRQGEKGDALYLVVSGRLRVLREDEDETATLAELGPGDSVGEIAVLGGERRLASVVAIRDTELAMLSKEAFHRLLEKHPLVAAPFFARQLVAIATNRQSPSAALAQTRSIALVGITPRLDLHEFTLSLSGALSRSMRTLHLTSRVVDETLGSGKAQTRDGDPGHANLIVWLNSKEQEYDCVLYETDADDTAWSRRCLRQADRILLVARAGDISTSKPQDAVARAGSQSVSLALIHDDGQEPQDTADWLRRYRVTQHHHLRATATSDFERLARFLTGRAIGVALGGGFARGVAHAGVLRAMDELGIVIDAIGGTSMGSLIALEYVYGYSYSDMIDITCRGGAESLHDWTLPLVSLLSGKKVRQVIWERTQNKKLEDLWLPCFTVATNLSRARIEVLTEGLAAEAFLASSRVPGMFPPVVRGDDLLVDGGLMSNVPADVMKPFCGGPVIAVDVTSTVDFAGYRSQHSDVSGWKTLFDRICGRASSDQSPTILSVLMRVMELESSAYRERMRAIADVYLTPPVRQYRFNDFKRGRQMAEESYQYAKQELSQWLDNGAGQKRRAATTGE